MAKKQFKAESRRLLELMINSIYTNKDIFLRELISNASDALDKRYYISLTDPAQKVAKKDLTITITRLPDEDTLIIEDTGIGMTAEELEKNLGTIARSGSREFREQLEKGTDKIDIIGQFGVGFYSAFMVARKVTVESRSIHEETGHIWTSTGEDGYTISESDMAAPGTKITLLLKADTEDEKYSEYLTEYKIRDLVKKYSDYVRYPINMEVTKSVPDPTEEGKYIETQEMETMNSMVPLWKKQKSKIKDEEYNEFYKTKFNDWEDPAKVIHYNVEGNLSYTALLFIPGRTPYNFYYSDFEPGIQLYSKGVFILDKAKDLIPDHYRFVTGLVDSDDLNLNISREMLQQDRQVRLLARSIEKKIHSSLEDMLKDEREAYEKFFDNFGLNLKYGIYKDYGVNKDQLQDLILFRSTNEGKYTTLKEYTERMKEGQKDIYYACGSSVDEIEKLPVMAKLHEKDYEVLYFLDERDEFVTGIMREYDGHSFRSVNQGDLDLESDEEKKAREEKAEENKALLEAMGSALGSRVKEVRLSARLVDDPVCLVSDENGPSIELEKYLANDPMNRNAVKATKILEINAAHPVFEALQKKYENDPSSINEDAEILYDQALLIQGLPIENPAEYARKITELLIRSAK
ncbi:MAG: molecular chaperone HtpG [Solobacterium sp.]|nr:molecular chaperone HtpG [Solobacterium sp.]